MYIQPRPCLGVIVSSTALLALCCQLVHAQQASTADKAADHSTGVRLIDATPETAAPGDAPSQVRETSADKAGEPTLAPTRTADNGGGLQPVEASKSDLQPAPSDKAADTASPDAAAAKPAGDEKTQAKLDPVPDAQPAGPVALEATSFHGVTPGVSTVEEMAKVWGAPKEIHKQGKTSLQLYAVEPFHRVEASCAGGKVTSIVIRFDKGFPANVVAQQLELAKIQPVLVSNELGEILGEAYPERGVLFSFEPSVSAGKTSMKVTHIILEAISAEPFVLRAETNLDTRPDFSLRDLDQAVQLQPGNARAHWLRGRVLASFGEYDKAAVAIAAATRLAPQDAHYRATGAQVLAQAGLLKDAAIEAEKAIELSGQLPHVKARALCLLGDIAASGARPDYGRAMKYHMQAVELADPLAANRHPAIRIAAKEVLLDAHLGAAHDIAWGIWREKDKAVEVWLGKASAFADDLINNEAGSPEFRFRVGTHALTACVGLRGKLDPAPWSGLALDSGKALIAAANNPARQARLQWDLGMALYDTLQLCQMRGEQDEALKHGETAAEYLEKGSQPPLSADNAYLLGRLYFRLGAIHAIRDKNHRLAVAWFDKALPLLEKPLPAQTADPGQYGESFVSMGVSYWETAQREKAIELTTHGVTLIEQAVGQGLTAKSALNVPYGNLAKMHRELGENDKANHFDQMATKNKLSELR